MKFLVLALLPALALGQLLGGITGGISDTTVDPNSEPVQFAVKAANTYLTGLDSSNHMYNLVQIVSARTQVVAGENLFLTLHMSGDYYCDVTVWYRSWLQGDERLQVTNGPTCAKHMAARQMQLAGGVSNAMPVPQTATNDEDQMLLKALSFAVCAYNDQSNNMFASMLGDTSAATYTQQVTSGMTYRFYKVPVQTTHCRNQGCQNTDLTTCNFDVHATAQTCSFTVQSQPWMNPPMTLTNISCA